jgi:hypothetical protein
MVQTYSIPAHFEAELVPIYEYWRARRRGDNNIPFWDDVNLPSLSNSGDNAALIDVFENPLRFRLGLAGRSMAVQLGPERNSSTNWSPRDFSIISKRNAPQQSVRGRPPIFDIVRRRPTDELRCRYGETDVSRCSTSRELPLAVVWSAN